LRSQRLRLIVPNPESVPNPKSVSNPESQTPNPCFACLFQPAAPDHDDLRGDNVGADVTLLVAIAREFSPRYEQHRDDLVTIDISGLGRLLGDARAIGEELRREASERGLCVHVAVAGTRTAAMVLAQARPGLTLVEPGEEANALAPIPIGLLERISDATRQHFLLSRRAPPPLADASRAFRASRSRPLAWPQALLFKSWGLKTLGELAALPPADLAARLGQQGLMWRAIACGADVRPLVPTLLEERFEASLELEWPIEGLEPLSFVLTRLLEPLSTRLERRDRGAAVLHVILRLVGTGLGTYAHRDPSPPGLGTYAHRAPSPPVHVRSLQLPAPIRDVRTLRTLALLDLESHPPAAAVDCVAIVIDPTPGRVLQHALFTRAHPTPEQVSTLLARLGALMGQDRLGAPAIVDSYRPGAFAMRAFSTEERPSTFLMARGAPPPRAEDLSCSRGAPPPLARAAGAALEPRLSRSGEGCHSRGYQPATSHQPLASALRRCRQPVPARVAVEHGVPVRVTTDRRGFAGGTVVKCAGPWRTSGEWWSACGHASPSTSSGRGRASGDSLEPERVGVGPHAREKSAPRESKECRDGDWNRDEWDVALGDGAVYRIFQDRDTEGWFIDAIVD
jgi:protein ImuB